MTLGQVKSVPNFCLFGPQRAEKGNIWRRKNRNFRTLFISQFGRVWDQIWKQFWQICPEFSRKSGSIWWNMSKIGFQIRQTRLMNPSLDVTLEDENMAWVPLALSSCAICRLFMSPITEFISVSVMPPRSTICTRKWCPLTGFNLAIALLAVSSLVVHKRLWSSNTSTQPL